MKDMLKVNDKQKASRLIFNDPNFTTLMIEMKITRKIRSDTIQLKWLKYSPTSAPVAKIVPKAHTQTILI